MSPPDSPTVPLHVLLISSSSGSRGGGELYLRGLAEGLSGLGCKVTSLLAEDPSMDELATELQLFSEVVRFPYRNTYRRKLRVVSAIRDSRVKHRVHDVLHKLKPDIVHLNKQNIEDGLDLLKSLNTSPFPALATIHVTRSMRDLGGRFGRLRDWIAKRIIQKSRVELLAISNICMHELNQFFSGSIESRLNAVPNGVMRSENRDRQALRNEWRIPDNAHVFGIVARIEAQKNPIFLSNVFSRLSSQSRLVWIGDGRLRPEFEASCHQLKITERVHIDGWQSDAAARMSGFDIFVLPSVYEGFPFALLEAMASGLPIVASDVDGVREAIVDGESGLLCECNNQEQWVSTLSRLQHDPELQQRLGQAARARYEQHFSLEAMARGTVEVYRKVIAAWQQKNQT